MKNTIPDISKRSYNLKTFPILYVQQEFQQGCYQYFENDIFDTYDFGYNLIIRFMKENLINTHKIFDIKNAPLI